MPAMTIPHKHIAVLDRMIKQLGDTFIAFQEDRHPDISVSTYARVCSDMTMQLETLKWFREVAARSYGDPAVIIDG